MSPRLDVDHISIGYDSRIFLEDICLRVEASEIVALLGASGSGKSTLLATIAGILPAYAGRILVDGVDVTSMPIHKRQVGMVFQDPLLFPHLSVVDNVAYGLRRKRLTKGQAREQAHDLLGWVGLGDLTERLPHQLSGGQAQRVALARTLAPEPAVVLLDEPFSALDTDLRQRLATEVADLLRERGVAGVHVTHDLSEAEIVGNRVVALSDVSHT